MGKVHELLSQGFEVADSSRKDINETFAVIIFLFLKASQGFCNPSMLMIITFSRKLNQALKLI